MSTAEPTTELEATQFDDIRPAISGRQLRWILFTIAAIVLLPMFYVMGRREVARWYLASMNDAIYKDDNETAIELADTALGWDSTNLEILSRKSSVFISMADAKSAAAVADQALVVARINYEGRPTPSNQMNLASALNQSAYAHALNGTKLESSLELIDEALGYFPNDVIGAFLDTRGYLHFLLGNDKEALRDMELAISAEERSYRETQIERRMRSKLYVDQSKINYEQMRAKSDMAVLYHHRGLVYQRLGDEEKAEDDLQRAERMGYDPENGVW